MRLTRAEPAQNPRGNPLSGRNLRASGWLRLRNARAGAPPYRVTRAGQTRALS